jgi:hypothetical protein
MKPSTGSRKTKTSNRKRGRTNRLKAKLASKNARRRARVSK